MSEPWNKGVRGTEVLPLINLDRRIIRVEAGPGTGKTFGLVRRVQRILHPDGLGVAGPEVLVVAFNRVIAKQLKRDIAECLEQSDHDGEPAICTVHALCLQVIRTKLRVLLPHEREAMIYDVRTEHPKAVAEFKDFERIEQALALHEAGLEDHMMLWQAAHQWLERHRAQLISDLPKLLLDSLKAGDFPGVLYRHVIVDEYQDLTAGEQALLARLRKKNGSFVALGDPRQSIYAFRGNDVEGLSKIGELFKGVGLTVSSVEMAECQRCTKDIVTAANRLMGLYPAKPMVPGNQVAGETHVVCWNTPHREAAGMANAIAHALRTHPNERHLIMVTRRKFGYMLRDQITAIDPNLRIDLNFSESLLETWSVREAFIFFCLCVDPDAPTWRAWLGYKNAPTGKGFTAPERNSGAYLRFLTACQDKITVKAVEEMAENGKKPVGKGGTTLWERARRFVALKESLARDLKAPEGFLKRVFAESPWITAQTTDADTAKIDMGICRTKALAMLEDLKASKKMSARDYLRLLAERLRYQIATREPFIVDEAADAQIATLWGAKGITADHVFILGLCDQAIPGTRRDAYPGTDKDYIEEQRRLFYVSITRSRKTLVLSRARKIRTGEARDVGLLGADASGFWVTLKMSRFLREIMTLLPEAEEGENWVGTFTTRT
jgi:DNA helicase II / ATP-dependent DNA helicase PcrA